MLKHPSRHDLVVDALIAVVLAGILCVPTLFLGAVTNPPTAIALALFFVVLLAVRRLAPLPALIAAIVVAAVYVAFLPPFVDAPWFLIPIMLYSVGRYGATWERIAGAAIGVGGAILAGVWWVFASSALLNPGPSPLDALTRFAAAAVPALLLFTLSVAAGALVGVSAGSQRLREERRIESEKAAIEQERAGIARDMHDIVAHSLAVVVAQANGARYEQSVEKKNESLAAISATAGTALKDVRGLLGQLRHHQAADPDASFARLNAMLTRVRAAGLDVRLKQVGQTVPLPPATDIAAYRIVQEALTNALRHGDTRRPASVDVRWGESLQIVIRNALDTPLSEPGHGLVGMRERARIAGGALRAAPTPNGEFVVDASFPLTAAGSLVLAGAEQ